MKPLPSLCITVWYRSLMKKNGKCTSILEFIFIEINVYKLKLKRGCILQQETLKKSKTAKSFKLSDLKCTRSNTAQIYQQEWAEISGRIAL